LNYSICLDSGAGAGGTESMLRAHMSYGHGGARLWWPRPRCGMGEEGAQRGGAGRTREVDRDEGAATV
jgi:hypothetical protein